MNILFLRQAHRFIRKADPPLRARIKAAVLEISQRPELGKRLAGKNLQRVRVHRFRFNQTSYRIAYTVRNDLLIIAVGTRENFYRGFL